MRKQLLIGSLAVAVVIGFLSGLLVAAISKLSEFAHALLFDIPFDAHLSASGVISWQRTLLVPMFGGVVLAVIGVLAAGRLKGQQYADAIEANALYGGRVSFRGSLLISIQTLLSNGFGASVGLEAAYAQAGGGLASALSSVVLPGTQWVGRDRRSHAAGIHPSGGHLERARAPGPGSAGRGGHQQGDRPHARHQPAHRRDLPRQRDVQDARRQPL